jgi:hypothetical protein
MDSSSVDISKFLKGKKDIIIISDVEGFCPKEQIAKIIEYASGDDKSKGVIFNGDVLDYTVGIEVLGAAHPDNLCALRLLKVLTNGMKAGNVICNIGNRDINKIKLLALLQAEDDLAWWESGDNISDYKTNITECEQIFGNSMIYVQLIHFGIKKILILPMKDGFQLHQ